MAERQMRNQPTLWAGGPFGDFRRQMDHLMDSFFGVEHGRPGFQSALSSVTPALEVRENDKEIVVTAELPGLSEDDVELSVREGVLTLRGEKKRVDERKEESVHVTERSYGSFQRSMTLPDRVDQGKIRADFDKGVLTITLTKKEPSAGNARKIEIGKS